MRILVFDMGHVFVDFDWQEVCAGFSRKSSRSMEELKQVFHHCSQLGYESGKVSTEKFLDELNEQLGTTLTLEEFHKMWVVSMRQNERMTALLQVLKQQRPLYLLSNTNEAHFDHLQHTYDVARHFEDLILSYKVGYVKPNPEIYHEVLRRCNHPAHNCLFIDDLEENVKAAQEVGMNAIVFKGVDDLKGRLAELGLRTE